MEKYPKHFLDTDGYEWAKGPFTFVNREGIFERHTWRFRPTAKASIWSRLKLNDHYWDYIDNNNMAAWGIKVAKVL
jgi:hypothetical protein